MSRRAPDKRQLGLALGAALAFLAAAVVQAAGLLVAHASGWRIASAAGFAGVAFLWFAVYLSWKKAAREGS